MPPFRLKGLDIWDDRFDHHELRSIIETSIVFRLDTAEDIYFHLKKASFINKIFAHVGLKTVINDSLSLSFSGESIDKQLFKRVYLKI